MMWSLCTTCVWVVMFETSVRTYDVHVQSVYACICLKVCLFVHTYTHTYSTIHVRKTLLNLHKTLFFFLCLVCMACYGTNHANVLYIRKK